MAALPSHQPKQLSLGPLEREILEIIWQLGTATAKQIHDRILTDPDRELAYTSVTTILSRLVQKGWLVCTKQKKCFLWQATISQAQAQALLAHHQLHQFLRLSNPEVVAAFADSLDAASAEQIQAIAAQIKAIRDQGR